MRMRMRIGRAGDLNYNANEMGGKLMMMSRVDANVIVCDEMVAQD